MSNIASSVEEEDKIRRIAEADLENLTNNLIDVIEVRKCYAKEYLKSTSSDERKFLAKQGIDYCNEQIKKVLAI